MKTPRKYFLLNLASILMMLVSFSLTFVAGMFAENTKIESCARDVVNIVNTKVPTKDLLGVTVEAGESGSLPNSEDQFYKLYGVFRQEKITFASGYNLTKQDNVRIDDLDPNFNFPVAYLQYTHGSHPYDRGHKKYKDDVYPVELMFPYDSEYLNSKKIVISDIHARSLLKTKEGIVIVAENEEFTFSWELKNTIKSIDYDPFLEANAFDEANAEKEAKKLAAEKEKEERRLEIERKREAKLAQIKKKSELEQ